MPLEGLISETNPEIHEKFAQRISIEKRLKYGELTGEERISLLREPFMLLNRIIEERAAQTHIDKCSGIGITVTLISFISACILFSMDNHGAKFLSHIAFITSGVGFIFTLLYAINDVKRFVEKNIYPRLIGALKPLKPSIDEINDVLRYLKSVGCRIAVSVRADKLSLER